MKKTNTLISLCILTSSVILPSYVSAASIDTQVTSLDSQRDSGNPDSRNIGDTDNSSSTEQSSSLENTNSINNKENSDKNVTSNILSKTEVTKNNDDKITKYESIDTNNITITPSYSENSTLTGSVAFNYKINIKNSSIKQGEYLLFKFSEPSVIGSITPNGGDSYGHWEIDLNSGIAKFTFDIDIDSSANLSFILNATNKNISSTNNNFTASSENAEAFFSSIFNTKYVSPGGGGSYNGQMTFPGAGVVNSGANGTIGKYTNNYIPGTSKFIPNSDTMAFNVIYDAGFYNNSKNDKINRSVTIEATGPNASLNIKDIYFSNKTGYPNTSTSFVEIASLGMTAIQVNNTTVKIMLPNDTNFSWGYFYFFEKTPNLDGSYGFKTSYSSDVYTTPVTSVTGGFSFQETGNKGFVPIITASDKNINLKDNIDNLEKYLLNDVSANDIEDGDITSKVVIKSDGGLNSGFENKVSGPYTITYSVTDSDGNTSTKSIVVVLYSAITIHYQDDSGNKIKDDLILSGNPGDTYTVDNTDVIFNNKNYYFISSDPSSLTGNYGSQGQPSEITLTYKENKQSINGSDFSMTLGDKEPTVSDFKASATDKDGNNLDVTADFSKVDFTKAGTYDVVLNTADGQSKTVKLTIKDNKQSINGSDYSMTLGDKEPTVSDFKASATDKDGNNLDVTADFSKVDFTKAGTYDVVLNTTDGQSKTVKLTIRENKQSINGSDYSMTLGDKKPTVSDFKASATDKAGNTLDVTADFTKVDFTKVGTYDVILTTTDGQSKTVKLTIKNNKASVIDHNNNKDKSNPSSAKNILSNNSKASLPSTGEQKTNLFYKLGAMLIVLALAIFGGLKKLRRKK